MAIIVTTKKHASSHKNAGLDQILLDEFGTPNDNTNLDASTTRHGLLKKLNNIATQYLNGQGNFTTPPDTGEVNTASNVGTGSGWFKTKNLLDLQFKSLIANSNKLSLTANTNDITLDVAEGNLTLGNIGGTIGTSKITDDAVTYAKMQNISATARLLGRITSGAGDTEELTGTQATTLLDVFTSALKGLVPSSGGGSTNYLRADGTWATPAGGGGGTEYDYIEQARQRVGFIEDFIDVGSSSNYAVTASGTGATVVNVDTVDLGTFGVAQATTGTTSSARAGVYFSSGTISHQIVRFGQGITTMEAKIRIPTLSTSGEEFKVEFGFSDDATSSTPTNRTWIEYDRLSSVNWRYATSNGTASESNSTTAVPANTWTRLKVEVNAAGNLVTYYVDGTSIGTKNVNIPTTEVYPIFIMYKSAGTTARTSDIDYLAFQVDLTTPR